jgi:hypothetical protein
MIKRPIQRPSNPIVLFHCFTILRVQQIFHHWAIFRKMVMPSIARTLPSCRDHIICMSRIIRARNHIVDT